MTQQTVTKSQLKVLSRIYLCTDCCNEVYDYATLHWTQEKIADGMPWAVTSIDGCTPVDGDGFAPDCYTEGRGFRLTQYGYEALTQNDAQQWPQKLRRFGTP